MPEPSGITPISRVPLRRGSNLGTGPGPEPPVDVRGLEIGPVASSKVALPARSPDVAHVASRYPLLNEFVLLRRLQGDGVHAMSAADVTRVEPVDLETPRRPVFPTEEVRVRDAAGVSVVCVAYSYGKIDGAVITLATKRLTNLC